MAKNPTSYSAAFDLETWDSTTNKKGQQRHGHLNWGRWSTGFGRAVLDRPPSPLSLLLSTVVSTACGLLVLGKIGWCHL